MQATIRISQGVCRMPEWRLAHPVDFEALDGEHIAITGPNGGGKSLLVDMITGRHPLLRTSPVYDFSPSTRHMVSDNIQYITFRDCYGGDNDHTYYLQQRWNHHDIDESTPTMGQLLDEAYRQSGPDTSERRALREKLYTLFDLGKLSDKYIILLSSGELRKYQLARRLMGAPRILIMDNPFIGLDTEARSQLTHLLEELVSSMPLQLILVLAKTDDMPDLVTHVVEVSDKCVMPKERRETYQARRAAMRWPLAPDKAAAVSAMPYRSDAPACEEVIKLNDVTIRYGERTILSHVDWTVRRGECWSLSGRNGSGKSTLLSLVCADNPQGYACDITLFGRSRGSGESIWDIKRHIGYVSPEMHRAYQKNLPAIHIVASGLKDSVGLYCRPTEEEYAVCRKWMDIVGVEGLYDRGFLSLSSGEQRLTLLARAFVKDPQLLILDEPLHGLDDANRQRVRELIDVFARRRDKTIIMVTHYLDELPSCVDHHFRL